jgi:hypothetical protein
MVTLLSLRHLFAFNPPFTLRKRPFFVSRGNTDFVRINRPASRESRGCLLASWKIVRGLTTTLKKIFFWNYARNTWQWDLLCVVCLIFIFLTPKSWFDSSELPRKIGHQSPVAQTLVLGPEVIVNEADKSQIEQRVKELTGRTQVEVVDVRKVVDATGRTRSFEVDIR